MYSGNRAFFFPLYPYSCCMRIYLVPHLVGYGWGGGVPPKAICHGEMFPTHPLVMSPPTPPYVPKVY